MSYTLKKRAVFGQEIKKSRFIATAVPVVSSEEAMDRVSSVKDPAASHNCFAYRISDNYRFSDDGEPGGTAGRPILSAIEGKRLDRVLVVVTRFFGGIKLGAGGLVRAYGGTAAKCLQAAELVEIREKAVVRVLAPFDALGVIYSLLEEFGCEKIDEKYLEFGVELTLELVRSSLPNFEMALKNVTRGKTTLIRG